MTGKDRATTVSRPLRTIFDVGAVAGLSDGELLERFAARRGESAELAFAALLERHGPMVLRVCRKVLGDRHDALDAFQATFLVLVRRARSIRKADSIASWLHGVAYRVALCDRSAHARRRKHERLAAESSDRAGIGGEPDDLGPLLHRELDRLPERFRAPLVLCHLEGLTHEQAAERLGWPVGTVKSRMARGRDRLRDRLTARGLEPSDGLGLAPLASPPPMTLDATARAATRIAAGQPIAGMVPASAVALMQGVLYAMTLKKIKLATAALLAAGALAIAAGVLADEPKPIPVTTPAAVGITYETRFLEMTGLDWRRDFHRRLKPIARKGPYTVWQVDEATLREITGRAKVVTAPKVTAFADAHATISAQNKTKIVAGFKPGATAPESGQVRLEGDVRQGLGKLDRGTTPKAGRLHLEADNLILTSPGQPTLTATDIKIADTTPNALPARSLDIEEIPDGVRVEFSGHAAPGGVLVRADVESTQIVSFVTNPIAEKVIINDAFLEGNIAIQVPELIEAHFGGEWLIPPDDALIVGLGIHRFSKNPIESDVRERLVAFRAVEVVMPAGSIANAPHFP